MWGTKGGSASTPPPHARCVNAYGHRQGPPCLWQGVDAGDDAAPEAPPPTGLRPPTPPSYDMQGQGGQLDTGKASTPQTLSIPQAAPPTGARLPAIFSAEPTRSRRRATVGAWARSPSEEPVAAQTNADGSGCHRVTVQRSHLPPPPASLDDAVGMLPPPPATHHPQARPLSHRHHTNGRWPTHPAPSTPALQGGRPSPEVRRLPPTTTNHR